METPLLKLQLKPFGINGGHFVISTVLIRQEYFQVGKTYNLIIKEAD